MAKEAEIRVLRVTSANRTSITPKEGEMLYETDTQTLYVGDGVTAGGNVPGGAGGTPDHGTLPGLGDDDHTQYHNDTRGDARYYQQSQVDSLLGAKENTITPGTAGQYYRGDKTFQTLDKAAVGLGNVDNTSDANKPVSTAQQTALNSKQDAFTWAQASNTNTTTNINTGTNFSTDVPIVGNYSDDGGSDFSQSGATGITCNFDGVVEVQANTHQGSGSQRPSPQIRTKLDGTPIGPVGASGYIRNSSGHNESSCHIQTFRLSVTNGQVITIGSEQGANSGTVTLEAAGTSFLYVKRVG